MDGTLAAVFLGCQPDGYGPDRLPGGRMFGPVRGHIARCRFQAAEVQFGDKKVGNEVYIGYDLGHGLWPVPADIRGVCV